MGNHKLWPNLILSLTILSIVFWRFGFDFFLYKFIRDGLCACFANLILLLRRITKISELHSLNNNNDFKLFFEYITRSNEATIPL